MWGDVPMLLFRRTGKLLVMFLLASLLLPAVAVASIQDLPATPSTGEAISFSLNPKGQPDGSFFEIEAKPGSTTRLTVEVSNTYSQPLSLRSFVTDVYTVVNGGMGTGDEGDTSQPPTAWIDYPAATYDLEPGEGREIEFSVNVPDDAEPGNYVSALILQTAEAVPVAGTSLFDQIIRKGVAIDITVPGEATPDFELGDVVYAEGPNVPTLTIGVSNTGDLRLRLNGTLEVKDATGTVILAGDVETGSIYARTATSLQLVLQQPLPTGEYTVTLNLTDTSYGVSHNLENVPFTVENATPVAQVPVEFNDFEVTPLPVATAPQFVTIKGTIANGGAVIPNARLTVHVMKDGEEVESFPLIPSLSLAQGETAIEQRYIPLSGFTSGTWTFSLTLESVDPSSSSATVILTQDLEDSLVIP